MNLKAKVYVENQKRQVEANLAARLEFLKGKGLEEKSIERDALLRKIRAQVRKSGFRLASIAAQERLNQERAQAKLDKLAAEQAAKEQPEEKPAKKAQAAPEKAEKKEKKGKKEKQEAKGEGKQEKKEKKEKKEKAPQPAKEEKPEEEAQA